MRATEANNGLPGRQPDGSQGPSLRVFINYRHADTRPTAWMLYARLKEELGEKSVFFDHGTLQPGAKWLDEIKDHIGATGIFLALIGPSWTSILTSHLARGDEDYVVKELDLALRAGSRVTVIPVTVDGAALPDAHTLPPSVRTLPDRQARSLRPTQLLDDIDELIVYLRELPAPSAPMPEQVPQQDEVLPAAHLGDVPLPPGPSPARRRVAPPVDDEHYRVLLQDAGNLVVFLGAAEKADGQGTPWAAGSGTLPNDSDLAKYLATRAGLAREVFDLAEVAQYARAIHGEMELFQWVARALKSDAEPGPVDRYLAGLPSRLGGHCQMIVTPKYDATLEKAFREANQDFDVAVYMAPGTELGGQFFEGQFVHLPWGEQPRAIEKPNEYTDFPIVAEDRSMLRTVIVRISGAVNDPSVGFLWEDNYVITEDHFIAYLSNGPATQIVPGQILAKLRRANYLFLGYTIADWRLRVFLQRISPKGTTLGRAKYWAVEQAPDSLERDLWHQAGVTLYESSPASYLEGLYKYIDTHPAEA